MDRYKIQIRRWLLFFIVSLFLSGLTAMPVETELELLTRWLKPTTQLGEWINRVYVAVADTNDRYPFIAYGYDWLAFAHYLLAILFIGPYKDPVRNKWVVEFAMIACLLILPFAMIAGHYRGIPFGWRLIDCSFGIIGIIPLLICYSKIKALERLQKQSFQTHPVIIK